MGLIVLRSDQGGVTFARFGYGDCRTTETGAREIATAGARPRRHPDQGRPFDLSLFSILRRNPLLVVAYAVWLTRHRAAAAKS
ncbi:MULTISPECIES: hypothetical protein [unclassified Bradyrhizobium]|uniref:hypothetical protein n=1 Tax=unclassified Bradyrhizobium TaxID=2631580 RepID=UPI001BA77482|nr:MULTISPECIES: hypothetical protein [unclassified Bradyrhizobium]MBR1207144.1 hypothetical protein [Bradyrhizobium sp. AUGA SZCCT0124]MBR1313683.1 hypothetical protein [Bradyrhizobium sp. AUGA SZCCT0051]MBR1343220.1 hypothetical protein [Bradyrhizobium sp. AUGA SZCCT0105]MBR1357360.1 hypothetical protein [Bradyrhizobium sp. AUGA SZCCT0045]